MLFMEAKGGSHELVHIKEEASCFLNHLLNMLMPVKLLVDLHTQEPCLIHTVDDMVGLSVHEVSSGYTFAPCESQALELGDFSLGIVYRGPGCLLVQHVVEHPVTFFKGVSHGHEEVVVHIGAAVFIASLRARPWL